MLHIERRVARAKRIGRETARAIDWTIEIKAWPPQSAENDAPQGCRRMDVWTMMKTGRSTEVVARRAQAPQRARAGRGALAPVWGRVLLLTAVLAATIIDGSGRAEAAQSPDISSTERAEVRLLASVDALAPGEVATLALDQLLAPNWHSYWINPGDAGLETTIAWTAPEGVEIGPIEWPTPTRFLFEGLMNYGYADRATLLQSISIPADWPVGAPIALEAYATWLVCEAVCVPEEKTFRLEIPTAAQTVADPRLASSFRAARAALPLKAGFDAGYALANGTVAMSIAAAELAQPGLEEVYFFPDTWGVLDHAAAQEVSVVDGALKISVPLSPDATNGWSEPISGVLSAVDASTGADTPVSFVIAANAGAPEVAATSATSGAPSGGGGAVAASTTTPAPAVAPQFSLLGAAVFAFLGGLILNLMPCVFPVLALKALSFANHAHEGGRERLLQGLAYAGGVLVSFLAFAAALIALKTAGAIVGWGFQLQTPIVVAVLAYVLFIVGLNLSGVFEIAGSWTGAGGALTAQGGKIGSFFTGVLAALVASPCTAPFMGAALGYAVTQDAATALLVFAALGLGFAAPIVALSAAPGAARVLPRPGPWMERFRQALAFPMYLAAAWLIWVLGSQAGVDAMFAALIGLVLVALAAWALGSGAPSSIWGRRTAAAAAIAALIGAVAALEPAMDAGSSPSGVARAGVETSGLGEPYDPARLEQLRAEGRGVFINMTADWCISCKVNERVVLSGDSFEALLDDADAVYMRGDWTRRDPVISEVLKAFGRVGVPLYVAYPAGGDPVVLPQILTEGIVREALTAG